MTVRMSNLERLPALKKPAKGADCGWGVRPPRLSYWDLPVMAPAIPQAPLNKCKPRGGPLTHQAVDHGAARQPDRAALVNATRGTELTWRGLQFGSLLLGAHVGRRGVNRK